jgi:Predicted membrane protein
MYTYSQGTFAEITRERTRGVAWSISWAIGWLHILGLFLAGPYAGRRNFFQQLPQHLPFIRKAMWWALALGLAGILARIGILKLPETRSANLNDLARGVLETAGFLAVSFCYAGAIILLVQRRAWRARLAPLAAVGRMALSNYLFESVICTTLFYSYGFRLFGKVGPAAGLVLTFTIYTIQIPLSVWWLRHFRFGPMEWVWRSLTYGKLQLMRL